MDHPNIARVLDAGATDAGRPYFVMELVRGVPITDYADGANLPTRDRLALFVDVCRAVQHAHQRGIIHRDLKPSNILVTLHDDRPVVKVIDFGIAKATEQRLTEMTLFTGFGQMIGTPAYMSPEQAVISGLDIDTRSDVYSLGVLLYELLAGSPPFEAKALRQAGFDEMRRIIREEPPAKPSTRLSALAADDRLTVAARRGANPQALGRQVSGDLDWIVLKAIEKDRVRRYESASAFAADVERHLNGEAVLAGAPGAAYKLRKFVGRHRRSVAAAGLVLLALVGGLAGTGYGLRRAVLARRAEAEQRREAEAQRDRAETVADFMSNTLRGVGPEVARGRDVTVLKEMMDAAAARIDAGDLRATPEAEVQLRTTIGHVYDSLGDFPDADRMLAPAVAMARALAPGDDPDKADTLRTRAVALQSRGDLAGAEPLFREALAIRRRLYPGDDAFVAATLNDLAVLRRDRGDLAEAESLAREGLAMRRRLHPGDDRDVAVSLNTVSGIVEQRGDLGEAERLLRASLDMQRRLFPGDHPDLAVDLLNLAYLLQTLGDLAGSESSNRQGLAMMRRLYPGDHPNVAAGLRDLAQCLTLEGDPTGAEPFLREAMAMDRRLHPGDDGDVAADLRRLGALRQARGDLTGAERAFADALAMDRRVTPGDDTSVVVDLNGLASARLARGDPAAAEPVAREAVAMSVRLDGQDAATTADARVNLGRALAGNGRFPEAQAELIHANRALSTADRLPAGRRLPVAEALAQLYQSWDAAEPGHGYAAHAVAWRATLAGLRAATRPTAPTTAPTTRAGP